MKRKISCFLVFTLLFSLVFSLPSIAYTRISYGVDCLASRGELIKSGLRGQDVVFCEADFKQALGVSRISSVTLLSLPAATEGVLKVKGLPAVAGQVVDSSEIGQVSFTPAAESVNEAKFEFCVGSQAGTTALTCRVRILDSINYAPTVLKAPLSSLYVETRRGVAVFGQMAAEDPEGDGLTFLVITYPSKGTLTVTDESTGAFRYTPYAGARGEDCFSYVARDSYGNYSSVASLRVTLQESDCETYTDMRNHPAHNAALAMTEAKIMAGEIEGAGLYFRPDAPVSRAEFVVMAMKAAGIRPTEGVTRTWFDDNESISEAEMPYLATAQLYGYISGYFDGSGLYFDPDRTVTRAEAAVILNNILDVSTPTSLPVFSDSSDIPAWAAGAIYALADVGILRGENGVIGARSELTRADTAVMLLSLVQYME